MSLTLFVSFECDSQEWCESADWTLLAKLIFLDLNKFCLNQGITPLKAFVMEFSDQVGVSLEKSDLTFYPISDALKVLKEIFRSMETASVSHYIKPESIVAELKKLEAYLKVGEAHCKRFYIGVV